MSHQPLPGGIPSRVSGLTIGVVRHLLSLGSLAAEEGRLFVRQSITGLILLMALILVAMIAYVALIACVVTLLAVSLNWGWPVSLAAAAMIHLGLVWILYNILRARISFRPFEATTAELQRDMDVLSHYSNRTP